MKRNYIFASIFLKFPNNNSNHCYFFLLFAANQMAIKMIKKENSSHEHPDK